MDQDGDIIDILKMRRRDRNAAKDRTLAGKLGDEYLQYSRREYVGTGLAGELAAAADERRRAERQAEHAARRSELNRIESAFAPLEEFYDAVEALARASLLLTS